MMQTLETLEICKISTKSTFDETLSSGEYCQQRIAQLQQSLLLSNASNANSSITINNKAKFPTISFIDFQVGDIALFMPANVNNRKIWMAFSSGSPYRFLAEVSLYFDVLPFHALL